MRNGKSPSRLRYESAHPTLTARVPADVKADLEAALAEDGTTFSQWVRRQVAGTAQLSRDSAAERQAGYAAGVADGRSQARGAYLILCAAMLWKEYGERLDDTNDSWIDRRAFECAKDMSLAVRGYLLNRMQKAPSLRAAVDRWLRDSNLPSLPA